MKVTASTTIHFQRKPESAISIRVSPENVILKRQGSYECVDVYVDLFEGSTRIPSSDIFGINPLKDDYSTPLATGVNWKVRIDANAEGGARCFYRISSPANEFPTDVVVPFTWEYKGVTYDGQFSVKVIGDGEKGDRGPSVRGPQAWDSLPNGYAFQSGAKGEQFVDIVVDGTNYYICHTSHTKSASNKPSANPQDANQNKLWQLGDKTELIATKVLLSEYAVVKNLGAEGIEMKDSSGRVVFCAQGGNVTCQTGTFNNVAISGQSTFGGMILRQPTMITPDSVSGLGAFTQAPIPSNEKDWPIIDDWSGGTPSPMSLSPSVGSGVSGGTETIIGGGGMEEFDPELGLSYYEVDFAKLGNTWLKIDGFSVGSPFAMKARCQRSMIGNVITIYNEDNIPATLYLSNATTNRDVLDGERRVTLGSGQMAILECVTDIILNQERVRFYVRTGSASNTIYNN